MYKIKLQKSKGKAGKWYWNLCSANGHVLATSQRYVKKPTAVVNNLAMALKAEVIES
jgi:uncharacterized protein YegP (UPF0339 family)